MKANKMRARMIPTVGACIVIYSTLAGTPAVLAEEYVREVGVEEGKELYSREGGEFRDLGGYEWAERAIEEMARRGVVSGIGNNRFEPGRNVSRVEFLSMCIRGVGEGGEEAIKVLAEGKTGEIEGINGEYWGNETIAASKYFGLTEIFGERRESWDKAASRAEMAYIAITVVEKTGIEELRIKEGIERNIGDYGEVEKTGVYRGSILKAYSNGIISGMNDRGEFVPEGNARRAEAASILWRLVDSSKRGVVEIKEKEKPIEKPVEEGSNVINGTVYPVEGQIGADGKPITKDPETGILGYGNGQKGGVYLGIKLPTGYNVEVGTSAWDSYGTMKAGDTYTETRGYVYWDSEWKEINKKVKNKLKDQYPPESSQTGLQADIEGNIIEPGSGKTAMFELKDIAGVNMWQALN